MEILYNRAKKYILESERENESEICLNIMESWDEKSQNFTDDIVELYRSYLMILSKIKKRMENEEYERNINQAIGIFEKISTVITRVENLDIFKDSIVNSTNEEKSKIIRIFIGIHEIIIEYIYSYKPTSSVMERFQEMIYVQKNIMEYKEMMKQLPINLKRGLNKSSMSLNFVADIIYDILCDATLSKQEVYSIFRQNESFIQYMLASCKVLLTPEIVSKKNENLTTSLKAKIMCKISKFCCSYIAGTSILNDDLNENGQKYFLSMIDMVYTYMNILKEKNNENMLFDFLLASSIATDDVIQKCTDGDSFRYFFVLEFIKFFEIHYEKEENRVCEKLLHIIQMLSSPILSNSSYLVQIIDYFINFCQKNYPLDNQITKMLFSIILNLVLKLDNMKVYFDQV